MLQARDVMTTEVVTINPEDSIEALARLLERRNIGGVPVVEAGGRLVGVITQTDLVKRSRDLELPPAINILDLHMFLETPSGFKRRLEKMLGDTVREVMTPEPITIPPDMPVKEIAKLMDREKVHTLPVMDRGKLVGIVGKMDLIRGLARQASE
jgi:CBS domain-containing protein